MRKAPTEVLSPTDIGIDEVMRILDETSRVIEANRRLEDKSRALEDATAELKQANARLQVLDRLKDDFVATVNHELRTPLTSIRTFSEILRDHPDLPPGERQDFLHVVVTETERLTRLINQLLDLSAVDPQFAGYVIEAVCIQSEKDHSMKLQLVADNSAGQSVLFKVELQDL